jgi:hypothetical protein
MKTKHAWNVISVCIRAFAISIGALLMIFSMGAVGIQDGLPDFLLGAILILFGLGHSPSTKHVTVYIKKEDAEELVRDK